MILRRVFRPLLNKSGFKPLFDQQLSAPGFKIQVNHQQAGFVVSSGGQALAPRAEEVAAAGEILIPRAPCLGGGGDPEPISPGIGSQLVAAFSLPPGVPAGPVTRGLFTIQPGRRHLANHSSTRAGQITENRFLIDIRADRDPASMPGARESERVFTRRKKVDFLILNDTFALETKRLTCAGDQLGDKRFFRLSGK